MTRIHSINKLQLSNYNCYEEENENKKNTTYFHSNNSIIYTSQFHATYGSIIPGRYFSSGTGYRYGFNGQEKSDEISGNGNHTTALFWEYDTRLGRRWNVDPKPHASISNYACFNNNPVINTDVNGDSAVCNSKGNMIHYDPNDKDLRVFLQKGKDLKLIGSIGGTIDVNDIMENILLENRQVAKKISHEQWIHNVNTYNVWDYKNKNSSNPNKINPREYSIFGIVWEYDNKNKNTKPIFTKFTYKNIIFLDASDFGNYHAGYTGTHNGIPKIIQALGAGGAETKKDLDHGDYKQLIQQFSTSIISGRLITPIIKAPYFDEIDDYEWNRKGMIDAQLEIDMDNNPQPIRHSDGTYFAPLFD